MMDKVKYVYINIQYFEGFSFSEIIKNVSIWYMMDVKIDFYLN